MVLVKPGLYFNLWEISVREGAGRWNCDWFDGVRIVDCLELIGSHQRFIANKRYNFNLYPVIEIYRCNKLVPIKKRC